MKNNNIYSVAQVNRYISNMFSQDFFLRNICVKGEVSNCKYHTSGHIYFSLKDETSAVNCVMFAGSRKGLAFRMKDGDKVVVRGNIEVYERDGRYQLYAKEITLEGSGALYERFLALKQELEDMGMFSEEYKQPIPDYVRTLGVVTAPTGAAVQDIRNVSLRRNPYLQIILYPAQVQGEGAAESIVRGIRALDQAGVDAIIVGRGGGSIEDLWAFNEEIVARAIFECGTPVISAVGHETDFTIADFVADLRAPTPSAAAELAVKDYFQVAEHLHSTAGRLMRAMLGKTDRERQRLRLCQERLLRSGPYSQLREDRQRLLDLEKLLQDSMQDKYRKEEEHLSGLNDRIIRSMQEKYRDSRHQLAVYAERFQGLSPLHRLKSGYSYVAGENGKAVTSTSQVKAGDVVNIFVTDGSYRASVLEITERPEDHV